MLTDDYILAILPLACLMADKPGIGKCCRMVEGQAAYHEVLRSGVFGYQLYTYHKLVQARFGEPAAQRVRGQQLDMLSHLGAFAPMLDMINEAVDIGTVVTATSQGEVITPVEMTVALSMLLGLPESVHYVTDPGQRAEQIARMPPEIDWCFADLLAHGRREMVSVSEALLALLDIPEPGATRRIFS